MAQSEEQSKETELWLRAKESDGIPRARSYHELSKFEYEKENYKEALSMCLVAKEIFEAEDEGDYTSEILDIYRGMSFMYENLNDGDLAESTLKSAIDIAKKNDSALLADLLRQLGRLYFDHENWEGSINSHLEANAIPNTDSDEVRARAVDFLNIGMAYNRNKSYEEAVKNHKIALQMFTQEEAGPYWVVSTHAEIAAAYVGLKAADDILYHAQIALDWFEMEEDHQRVWSLKYNKAIAYRIKGEFEFALELLSQARALAKENCKNFNVFAVDFDKEVGEIWIQQGKVKAGTEMVRRAESVKKSLERKHPLSRKEVA